MAGRSAARCATGFLGSALGRVIGTALDDLPKGGILVRLVIEVLLCVLFSLPERPRRAAPALPGAA